MKSIDQKTHFQAPASESKFDAPDMKSEGNTQKRKVGTKSLPSPHDPRSEPKRQKIEQRDLCTQAADKVYLHAPPKDFTGTTLSELCRFLPDDDRQALIKIAANDPEQYGYRETLASLSEQGLQSESYYSTETCNALYWGLMNGELTPDEFLKHHFALMVITSFSPATCEDWKPTGIMNLESRIKSVSLDQLDLGQYSEDDQTKIRSLIKNNYDTPDVFEISFPDGFQQKIAETECQMDEDTESLADEQTEFFMRLPQIIGSMPGVWFTTKKDKIIIGSLPLMLQIIQPADESIEPVEIKPVFGSIINKDQLKAMRLDGQCPMQLWHPAVNSSAIKYNGVWLGTLTGLPGLYSAHILNTMSPEKRQELLRFDTEVIVPRKEFYQRIITDKPTEEDEFFLIEFTKILAGRYNLDDEFMPYSKEDPDQQVDFASICLKRDKWAVTEHCFVDQHSSYEKLIAAREQLIEAGGSWRNIQQGLRIPGFCIIKEFVHQYFIFQVAMNNDNELAQEVLGIEVREYPDAVQSLLGQDINKEGLSYKSIITNYLIDNPETGTKLDMTHWLGCVAEFKQRNQRTGSLQPGKT